MKKNSQHSNDIFKKRPASIRGKKTQMREEESEEDETTMEEKYINKDRQ